MVRFAVRRRGFGVLVCRSSLVQWTCAVRCSYSDVETGAAFGKAHSATPAVSTDIIICCCWIEESVSMHIKAFTLAEH